jgi:hypothetical protein
MTTLIKILSGILLIALAVLVLLRQRVSNFVGSTFVIQPFPIGDTLGWCGTTFPNNLFRVLLGVDKFAQIGRQYSPYYFCEVRVPAKVDQKAPINWLAQPKMCAPNFTPSPMETHFNPGKWAPSVGKFFLNLTRGSQQLTTTYYGIVPPAVQSSVAAVINPVAFAANAATTGVGYAQSSGAQQSLEKAVDAISETTGDSHSYYYRCDPAGAPKSDAKLSASTMRV